MEKNAFGRTKADCSLSGPCSLASSRGRGTRNIIIPPSFSKRTEREILNLADIHYCLASCIGDAWQSEAGLANDRKKELTE